MSKLPGDEGNCFTWTLIDFFNRFIFVGLETVIGSSRPTPVYFYAQKTSSYGAQGPIPFEVVVVNIGDALNLRTGVFTAPVSGVYFFSFDAYSDSGESRVHLQKNGVNVGQSFDYDYNYRSQQLHLASILQLDAGDEIQVYLGTGRIYEDGNSHFTHFTGMLLNDDVLWKSNAHLLLTIELGE